MALFEDNLPYYAWGIRYLDLRAPAMRGTDVKVFQTLFNLFLRYSAPPKGPVGFPIACDGIFGPKTSQAVHQWQEYFGLANDGVIGPITGASLGQYDAAYGGPRFGSRGLMRGETGGDVYVLQNRLDCYYYGHYFARANGDFDRGVEDAVRHFQGTMNTLGIDPGVPTDGQVHFETFDALWAYTYVGGRDVYEKRNGLDTLWIQRFLEARRFLTGPLDGYFGPGTKGGVMAFQGSQHIAQDGIVGPVTMHQIGQVFNQPAGMWP